MKQFVVYSSFLFIIIMTISSCFNIIPSTATLVLENDSDKVVDIYIESTKNNISDSFPLHVEIIPSASKKIALSWKEFGDIEVNIFGKYINDIDKTNVFYIHTTVMLKHKSTLKKTVLSIVEDI